MSKNIFTLIFTVTLLSNLRAQDCCKALQYKSTFRDNAAMQFEEQRIQDQILKDRNAIQTRSIITIPIVVHVIYNRDEENIPDAQIYSQIDALNRDYRHRNADSTKTPNVWKPLAADIGIEFCLAVKDTLGNVTTGITRTKTTQTFIEFESVKQSKTGGYDNWNPQKYLNIWVTNIGGGYYGFSPYPTQLVKNPGSDGVVVHYKAFGISPNNFPNLNLGRTAVHEVGHWLNLLHPFGDSSSVTCATDFVADTPPEHTANHGCPVFPKWDDCTFGGNGVMFMNYMDYSDDACMNLFTLGQKERMLAALNLYRSSILSSNACGLVSVSNDVASISFSVSPNPISSNILLCNFEELIAEGYINIFDVSGKSIFNQKFYSSYQQILSLPTLNAGLYFVQLITDKGRATIKIIKN